MKPHEKFYTSRDPHDDEIVLISEVLTSIDLPQILKNSFIYIVLGRSGAFEVLSFQNEHVFITSKELKVNNKMAIEFLIDKAEIEQELHKVLFENKINGIKKFKAVKKEKLTRKGLTKVYHSFEIYDYDLHTASKTLEDIGFKDYLYLQDVSKEE